MERLDPCGTMEDVVSAIDVRTEITPGVIYEHKSGDWVT